jgi:hypothetical protein
MEQADHEGTLSAVTEIVGILKPLPPDRRADAMSIVARLLKIDSSPGPSVGHRDPPAPVNQAVAPRSKQKVKKRNGSTMRAESPQKLARIDLNGLVNWLKEFEGFGNIEESILNSSADIVDRLILPIAIERIISQEPLGLTSGDVQRFYKQLDLALDQPLISRSLSGKGKAVFIGDGIRTKGVPVRYRLSRAGVQKAIGLGIPVK